MFNVGDRVKWKDSVLNIRTMKRRNYVDTGIIYKIEGNRIFILPDSWAKEGRKNGIIRHSEGLSIVENMNEDRSNSTTPEFKQKLASLFSYLINRLGIREFPMVKLANSKKNSENPFGLTGCYDHEKKIITLYITDRHDTDILRSFAHEVIHHWQNLRGTLHPQQISNNHTKSHYAQDNPWLRKREIEAFLFGSLLLRDWQDEQRYGPPDTPPVLPQPLDENLAIGCHKARHFSL